MPSLNIGPAKGFNYKKRSASQWNEYFGHNELTELGAKEADCCVLFFPEKIIECFYENQKSANLVLRAKDLKFHKIINQEMNDFEPKFNIGNDYMALFFLVVCVSNQFQAQNQSLNKNHASNGGTH